MERRTSSVRTASLAAASLLVLATPGLCQAWLPGPKLIQARYGLDAVEHGGAVFAIGGWNAGKRLDVLYPGASSWAALASMPTAQEGGAAARVGDRIYTMGSYGPSAVCQVYDITAGTWSAGPKLPEPLYWASAEAVGDRVYLIGGYTPTSSGPGARDTLYILNTVSLTWTLGAPMPAAIQVPASAAHDKNLYVFGHGKYFKYDIPSNLWSTFPGPPSGHGNAAEAVTVEGSIYLLAGNQGNIFEAYRDTEVLDLATGNWSAGPDLVTGRYQFGAVYLADEDRLCAVGGRDAGANPLGSVELLDLAAPALYGDVGQVSLSAGGVQTMTLVAGPPHAGLPYLLMGSHSGMSPGIPVDGHLLPLNPDPYWIFTLTSPNQPPLSGSFGALDWQGRASAAFTVPAGSNPAFAGIVVYHAYAVFDTAGAPASPQVTFVSAALPVTFAP